MNQDIKAAGKTQRLEVKPSLRSSDFLSALAIAMHAGKALTFSIAVT